MADLGAYVGALLVAPAFFAVVPGWVLWLIRKST